MDQWGLRSVHNYGVVMQVNRERGETVAMQLETIGFLREEGFQVNLKSREGVERESASRHLERKQVPQQGC